VAAITGDRQPIGETGRALLARRSGALLELPIELLIKATGILTVLLLFGILVLLANQGAQLFLDRSYSIEKFLTFDNAITTNTTDPDDFEFGILPPVIATMWVTLVCLFFAVPLGLLTAVYISELAPPRQRLIIKSLAELLAGVPTVIFAFVGLALVVPEIQQHFGWGAGGLSGVTRCRQSRSTSRKTPTRSAATRRRPSSSSSSPRPCPASPLPSCSA
jgi:ABC-type phosphate transport system permease subunit